MAGNACRRRVGSGWNLWVVAPVPSPITLLGILPHSTAGTLGVPPLTTPHGSCTSISLPAVPPDASPLPSTFPSPTSTLVFTPLVLHFGFSPCRTSQGKPSAFHLHVSHQYHTPPRQPPRVLHFGFSPCRTSRGQPSAFHLPSPTSTPLPPPPWSSPQTSTTPRARPTCRPTMWSTSPTWCSVRARR